MDKRLITKLDAQGNLLYDMKVRIEKLNSAVALVNMHEVEKAN